MRAALRKGAKVNAKDPATGDTALFAAAADNRDARVVSALIKAGASVNVKDDGGMTPLMVAGKPDIARALIKAGADVNATDKQGWTPLIYAVSKAALDKTATPVVAVLVKAGANVGMKDKDGDTALSVARKAKAARLVALLARARKPARR
ncbi:MAG: ankyrin repeat domain-containing protein [Elusimicrobia bacterium]|nr:ankyrin repeat domain-containing protein [Elusimicrobiota bacterium]